MNEMKLIRKNIFFQINGVWVNKKIADLFVYLDFPYRTNIWCVVVLHYFYCAVYTLFTVPSAGLIYNCLRPKMFQQFPFKQDFLIGVWKTLQNHVYQT